MKVDMKDKPRIGITMGDGAGVGPEIIVAALADRELYELCRPLVIGDRVRMEQAVAIMKAPIAVRGIACMDEARFAYGTLDVLDLMNLPSDLPFAVIDGRAGRAAYDYVAKGVEMAMACKIDAIATAPLNKEALKLGGCSHPGHTEILAALSGTGDYAMMLVSKSLRVIHVSTHVPLRRACDLVKKDRVLRVIKLADEALRSSGIAAPRIAVAGLNPHAGEGGLFGDEEREEIEPAVREAQRLGFDASGPLPPDTVFYRAAVRRDFDIVVVMYHDQGHIPLKLHGFEAGVNVTLGLPFIRTSVDHGTAFDIAGQGVADSRSMVEAIRLAATMANAKLAKRAENPE
ncbi:MAG: 4-hydroxythreonine-4-phosphate dehydrogenase PdxA, partial [Syntrophales bacterium]|nr:4-hydroxythreonine-4-phosphate dehydrogenase PdxA [Syntrophales bacterium]